MLFPSLCEKNNEFIIPEIAKAKTTLQSPKQWIYLLFFNFQNNTLEISSPKLINSNRITSSINIFGL